VVGVSYRSRASRKGGGPLGRGAVSDRAVMELRAASDGYRHRRDHQRAEHCQPKGGDELRPIVQARSHLVPARLGQSGSPRRDSVQHLPESLLMGWASEPATLGDESAALALAGSTERSANPSLAERFTARPGRARER
jgi:hypothetical protein